MEGLFQERLIALCQTDEIPDPGSKGFRIQLDRLDVNLFVVHRDGQFHAFINSCPHTRINLEWQEDRFLNTENTYIQCTTHGALFEISTGKCVSGPCIGDCLTAIKLTEKDNVIFADM